MLNDKRHRMVPPRQPHFFETDTDWRHFLRQPFFLSGHSFRHSFILFLYYVTSHDADMMGAFVGWRFQMGVAWEGRPPK